MIDPRLITLRTFAETGTIAATAELTGYSPSAVSAQLRDLQNSLGMTLLTKDGRGLRLTATGRYLVRRSDRLISVWEEIRASSFTAGDQAPSHFGIGGFSTASATRENSFITTAAEHGITIPGRWRLSTRLNRNGGRIAAEELLADPKELAEHLMLLDLGRNDVGRVAKFGTVHVDELMTLERYSHVMHLVSTVYGRLAPGKQALDAVAACFPAGGGAPTWT